MMLEIMGRLMVGRRLGTRQMARALLIAYDHRDVTYLQTRTIDLEPPCQGFPRFQQEFSALRVIVLSLPSCSQYCYFSASSEICTKPRLVASTRAASASLNGLSIEIVNPAISLMIRGNANLETEVRQSSAEDNQAKKKYSFGTFKELVGGFA